MSRRPAFVLFALAVLASGVVRAQVPAQFDSVAQKYRADYAVPDAPALTLLDRDQSDLVRPTTVRELAVALSDFTGPGGLQLPKAAGVEFSPGMLFFGRRLKLRDYQKAAALYRLRISVATRREADGGPQTALAFGVRTSLIDGADLRTNQAFLREARHIVDRAAEIDAAAEDRAAEKGGITEPVVYSAAEQKELDGLVERYQGLAESVADSAWNKRVLDLALGARAEADSSGRNLRMQQYAAWLTYGDRLGGWGQVIIGAKVASDRDSVTGDFAMSGSAAGRLYGGTNRYKVFVDFEASKRGDEDTRLVLGGGAELRVAHGLWTTLAVGRQWNGPASDSDLKARFAFKAGFPMK